MTQSLLLDRSTWDWCLDANGNLAVCTEPYSVLQDVSNAIRTLLGEVWYDTSAGLPYLTQILGFQQRIALFKARAQAAAEAVNGVASATIVLANVSRSTRQLTGQVQVTTTSGTTAAVSF